MSDKMDDQNGHVSRPKRHSSVKEKKRELLEKMRNTYRSGKKNKYDIGEVENVYEEVDEREYSRKVLERQEDDWIVDDGGCGYVEDGREIFDDDLDEESLSRLKNESKKRSRASLGESSLDGKKGNIRNMIVNMPTKKKKEIHVSLEEDKILEGIIGELGNTSYSMKEPVKEKSAKGYLKSFSIKKPTQPKPSTPQPKPAAPQHGRSRPEDANSKLNSVPNLQDSDVRADPIIAPESVKIKEEPIEIVETPDDEDPVETVYEHSPPANKAETEFETMDFDIPVIDAQTVVKQEPVLVKEEVTEEFKIKQEHAEEDIVGWNEAQESSSEQVVIDNSSLPLIKNESGEEVLRFYFLDAHEDIFTQPGTVYLFGKVWIDSAKSYASCCIVVKNIDRQIFLLPREKRTNLQTGVTSEDVAISDVYEEFNSVVSTKYKIKEFRSRKTEKKYAFGKEDIPLESEYLEVRYSASIGPLPSDLKGETFSYVFGTKSSFLELLLLDRSIKGPCWIDVHLPKPMMSLCSWCKFEAECLKPTNLSVLKSGTVTDVPPLVMLVLVPQVLYNQKSKQNEIVALSCLVNNEYPINKPPPKRLFTQHFCILSKPSDVAWPFDIKEEIRKFKNTNVDKMESERALLNFFLTRLYRIDPDIIVGHDLSGYLVGLMVDRLAHHKIPNWSRFGRLRRSAFPSSKSKQQIERAALSGRLLCDIKISAKELIRCRSYELGVLCQNVLNFKEDKRPEMTEEDFKHSYSTSLSLLNSVWNLMSDSSYIVRILAELNVIPLALQITNIAGNLMSRTLLGGRSERNEYLLLHAFHSKGYIVPDKEYKKMTKKDENDLNEDDTVKVGLSKKKPAYAGGLVLDPKVGFYNDDLILLMDFNSLYPSIIQEYNICFTTVQMNQISELNDAFSEEFNNFLPDNSSEPGILPTEIRKLVESRKDVKRMLKSSTLSPDLKLQYNIRQMALKLTANSMYGCLGFTQSRFYAKPLAAIITAKGREILLNTKKMVESFGYEIIYGDTDSLMINSRTKDLDMVYQIGRKIKFEVNKCYKQLELDIDGVYKYMLLLRKKKYAAVMLTKTPTGEIEQKQEIKGLDIVRRDWCQLSSEAGKLILSQILSDLSTDDREEAIHGYLKKIRHDLEQGEVPMTLLAVTKQLTKPPEDYTDVKRFPHVQVALRMNASMSKRLKQGDAVSYIICEDGTNNPAMQRAYHIEELKGNTNLKIDVQYYLSQQIYPVIARLYDPICTDPASLALTLGLDPTVYARKTQSYDTEDNIEHFFGRNEEERYKDCERFSFKCKNEDCSWVNTVEGPLRKNDKGFSELVLEKCSNPACSLQPITYLPHIQNMLQIQMRGHIRKYYEGWLVCEDPVCGYRTTRINSTFEGAYPVCQKCANSVMHKEVTSYQLYNQLCYYSFMFDLSKVSSKQSKFEPDTYSAYGKIFNQVKDVLNINKYSVVDLGKLFAGIFHINS